MLLPAVKQSRHHERIDRLIQEGVKMLETIIVVLLILWLVGFFGGGRRGIPRTGNVLHILLVIVVILLIVRLLQ